MKKATKITLCGYYGRGNLGDEIILKSILNQIKAQLPYAKICVLNSKNPLSNARKLAKSDIFIFGGGSILQNSTSDASLFYYLTTIRLASLLCKRKIMLSNGVGPLFERKIPLKIIEIALARTLNCFDLISVRDTASQKLLKKLLPNRKIHLVPDPALIEFKNLNRKLSIPQASAPNPPFFVFCPHANSLKNQKISSKTVAKALLNLSNAQNLQIKIAVFNKKEDLALAKSLQNHLKNAEIFIPLNANEAAHTFWGAKFVISSRYHASLLAISLGIPTLSISNDPKITTLATDFSTFPALPFQIFQKPLTLNKKNFEMQTQHSKNKEIIAKKIAISTHKCEISIDKILK